MSNTNEHLRHYKLFLSHTWEYQSKEQELVQLLGQQTDFSFQTMSVDPQFARQVSDERVLYETIRNRMKHSDAVLILCGLYSNYSRSINKELIAAKSELHKPLLGIQPFPPERTSLIVKQHADLLVPFEADAIAAALGSLIDKN